MGSSWKEPFSSQNPASSSEKLEGASVEPDASSQTPGHRRREMFIRIELLNMSLAALVRPFLAVLHQKDCSKGVIRTQSSIKNGTQQPVAWMRTTKVNCRIPLRVYVRLDRTVQLSGVKSRECQAGRLYSGQAFVALGKLPDLSKFWLAHLCSSKRILTAT